MVASEMARGGVRLPISSAVAAASALAIGDLAAQALVDQALAEGQKRLCAHSGAKRSEDGASHMMDCPGIVAEMKARASYAVVVPRRQGLVGSQPRGSQVDLTDPA